MVTLREAAQQALDDMLDLLAMGMQTPRKAAAELRRLHAKSEKLKSLCRRSLQAL